MFLENALKQDENASDSFLNLLKRENFKDFGRRKEKFLNDEINKTSASSIPVKRDAEHFDHDDTDGDDEIGKVNANEQNELNSDNEFKENSFDEDLDDFRDRTNSDFNLHDN